MRYKTIREAAEAWVREFNQIPTSLIEKLMNLSNLDEVYEITPPCLYDRVHICGDEWAGNDGEIFGTLVNDDPDLYVVKLDETGEKVSVCKDDIEVNRDGWLPMWGTMWAFKDGIDNEWLSGEYFKDQNGLQKMADCGFRIYEQEDYTYMFGIDGAGYDFYEQHWIPLYKARGLQWHEEE